MLELTWVTSPAALLLWAQVVLAWTVVHYGLFARDPTGLRPSG